MLNSECVIATLHNCVEQALVNFALWRAASQLCQFRLGNTYDAVAVPFPHSVVGCLLRFSLAGLGMSVSKSVASGAF